MSFFKALFLIICLLAAPAIQAVMSSDGCISKVEKVVTVEPSQLSVEVYQAVQKTEDA